MYHYTYLLISKLDGRLYIGARTSKVPPEEDTYMSSAKTVSKEYKRNCTKSILKTFFTRKEALMHEIYLHNLFEVSTNPEFFNKAKQTSTKFDTTGVKLTKEHKAKVGRKGALHHFYGKHVLPQVVEKIRKTKLNNPYSNYNYDHTIYHWYNLVTKQEISCTRQVLAKKFNLQSNHLGEIIKGVRSTHKNWTINKKEPL